MRHILTALLCLFALGSAFAQESDPVEVTVTWDPPTQRLDGLPMDPATEISHYTLLCATDEAGPFEGGYQIPGLTPDGTHAAALTDVFPDGYGDYWCVLTATDTDGRESGPSNVATFRWAPASPGSPTQLLIIRVQ